MFYFTKINEKTVLKSDMIKTEHFFTTRESIIKTKEPDYTQTVEKNKYSICDYLNIKYENLISPSQTHTSNIQLAKSEQKIYH